MPKTEDLTTFGGRLRAARLAKKMSQKDLAAAAGISQALVSELEKNEYRGTAHMVNLARLTGVRPLWLEQGRGTRHTNDPDPPAENVVQIPMRDSALPFERETINRLRELPPRWQGRAEQAVLGVIADYDRTRRKRPAG